MDLKEHQKCTIVPEDYYNITFNSHHSNSMIQYLLKFSTQYSTTKSFSSDGFSTF